RPLVAPPELITLVEPPLPLPEPPEVELPEVTPRELQLLLEPEEEAPELELPLPPRPAPPELPPLPPLPPPPEVTPPARPRPRPRPPRPEEPTQIPTPRIREQLGDLWGETAAREPLEPPHRIRRPPSDLLSNPCHALPPVLLQFWERCFRPRPPAPPPEMPSEVEVLREALEPSLAPPTSELSLEPLEEEPSIPPLPAPPPEVVPEVPEPLALDLRRLLLDHAQPPEGAELGAILSPDWPRPLVARAFALCLELCAAHWLQLEQPRPYGPIRIRLRPRRQ
ncbi:meiotic recombination protein REC8 homolog, partial [Chamaea fasciata]|uniref:meiotic recombination protein REC8 homolog n=1 Tax=Chamaea fasciata TaxID=190680 RepID=UPI003369FADC